jgi:hypothetical protein
MDSGDKVWVKNHEITPLIVLINGKIEGEGFLAHDGKVIVRWFEDGEGESVVEWFEDRTELLSVKNLQLHIGQPFRYTTMEPRS